MLKHTKNPKPETPFFLVRSRAFNTQHKYLRHICKKVGFTSYPFRNLGGGFEGMMFGTGLGVDVPHHELLRRMISNEMPNFWNHKVLLQEYLKPLLHSGSASVL